MRGVLERALQRGLCAEGIGADEALEIAALPPEALFDVLAVTNRVRERFKGRVVNLCSIVNAKSGLCPEDCSFCAQSVRYRTGVDTFPLLPAARVLEAARRAEEHGAGEFSIVTSGTRLEKESDLEELEHAIRAMHRATGLESLSLIHI